MMTTNQREAIGALIDAAEDLLDTVDDQDSTTASEVKALREAIELVRGLRLAR